MLFLKRNFVLLFCIFSLLLVVGFAIADQSSGPEQNPAKKLEDFLCGNSNKVLFGFNDAHHTQFLIPEAYLDDPYNAYHKIKDPAEFISISVAHTGKLLRLLSTGTYEAPRRESSALSTTT